MSLETFGKLPKKDDSAAPANGPQDSHLLQNFVDVVAAFEKNVANMNQQLQMQLQASTPLPTPKQAFAHLQYPPQGTPYPTWDGRLDTERHPRRMPPQGNMIPPMANSASVAPPYGNIWDNFGSLPRKSHSKTAQPRGADYPMSYNPEALYENSTSFDGVRQESDRYPNMGFNPHPTVYPGYQQAYPQTQRYPYGATGGSFDYPALGHTANPGVPNDKSYHVPVMIPPSSKGSYPQLDDTSSSPLSTKSRSRSWWPTSNLSCKKRNKSKEDLKSRNGNQGRSASPETPVPSRARSSTRLPTASPALRRANSNVGDYSNSVGGVGGAISMGDMSQMLRDAERQIARLKREQMNMNHHFEGSRRDVMVLQAENDKLKQDYLRLHSELNQLKTTSKSQSSSVPQLSSPILPPQSASSPSPSPSLTLHREQSSSRNTINRDVLALDNN